MTKILAVDADGLLMRDHREIPNCDPLMPGLAFFNRLRGVESVLMLTRADLTDFSVWAMPFGIERTWLVNPDRLQSAVTAAQSFAGRQHSTLALYVTADASDAHRASERGIATALYFHPVEDNRLAISRGPGWAMVGIEPVEDTPDEEDEA